MSEDQLRCNICGIWVSLSQAKQHASSSTHESRRMKLEQELKTIRKENYINDSSVIVQWESSLTILR
jgi:hypothetical protein